MVNTDNTKSRTGTQLQTIVRPNNTPQTGFIKELKCYVQKPDTNFCHEKKTAKMDAQIVMKRVMVTIRLAQKAYT